MPKPPEEHAREWFVYIRRRADNVAVKKIECGGARIAASVLRGASINLNHDDYFVEVSDLDEEVPEDRDDQDEGF